MSVASFMEHEIGQLGLTRAPPETRGMIRGPNGRPRADQGLGGLMTARQANARNAWESLNGSTRNSSQPAAQPAAVQPAMQSKSGVRQVGTAPIGVNFPSPSAPPVPPALPPSMTLAAVAVSPQIAPSSMITDALSEALASASSRLESVDVRLGAHDVSLTAAVTKLDAFSMRLGTQDNDLKTLRQSVTALRSEYSSISQATDGQSAAKLEALERSLSQLTASFQSFSARLERDVQQLQSEVEQTRAFSATDVSTATMTYRSAVVLETSTGLPALTPIQVRGEARVGKDGIYMVRQTYDAQHGLTDVDIQVELSDGTPCIAFV